MGHNADIRSSINYYVSGSLELRTTACGSDGISDGVSSCCGSSQVDFSRIGVDAQTAGRTE